MKPKLQVIHGEAQCAPKFEKVEIIEDGQAVAILLREWNGTVSAIRIGVEQIAD